MITPVPLFNYFGFLLDPANWGWSDGSIPQRLVEHLGYTVLAVLIAAAIALPIGLLIGHTNRGAFLAINIGNAGRALPTFGLLSLMVVLMGTGLVPALIALVVLAVPPILASTYAGIRAVDRSAVDAAVGMGMRPTEVLFRAEVPMALPLIMSGLRSSTLQVCATATVAAYVGLGGLGRFLIDGLARNQYDQVFAGAVLVAALAIALDLAGAGLERAVVSPGVRQRGSARRGRRRGARSTDTSTQEAPTASTAG
ncbi:MAG: ABC transporter permease [Nocardioidaceae bacterium]|nr:ABC transporter permease [Nocardioidaceae bacterium]NUS51408.1 ABC transporter permease [Nocardioidaceae bacterium]